jgi:hypothetical protein
VAKARNRAVSKSLLQPGKSSHLLRDCYSTHCPWPSAWRYITIVFATKGVAPGFPSNFLLRNPSLNRNKICTGRTQLHFFLYPNFSAEAITQLVCRYRSASLIDNTYAFAIALKCSQARSVEAGLNVRPAILSASARSMSLTAPNFIASTCRRADSSR